MVSGLVREIGCVKSCALAKNGWLQPRRICSKKASQLLYKELLCTAIGSAKREEEGSDLLKSGHLMD